MSKYDSAQETQEHINTVAAFLLEIATRLALRSMEHDKSKLESPEKEMFDEATPKLKGLTYGSDEYKRALAEMGEALRHHYANNSHHPEHYENGINGMNLLDLVEMLCDWKAATLRHDDGNLMRSLDINRERFEISEQLTQILENTVHEMSWE